MPYVMDRGEEDGSSNRSWPNGEEPILGFFEATQFRCIAVRMKNLAAEMPDLHFALNRVNKVMAAPMQRG